MSDWNPELLKTILVPVVTVLAISGLTWLLGRGKPQNIRGQSGEIRQTVTSRRHFWCSVRA